MIRDLGADPVIGDLFDAAAMRAAVHGSEAVLHLATRIPPFARMRRPSAWRDNDRVRTEGAHILVDAALAVGARTYVQESVTFLYAPQGDRWLDETAPIEVAPLLVSAYDAERETARFGAQGGAGVVLRFATFYASYAPSTIDSVRLARWRLFTIIGAGDHYMSAIHVDDAATAVVAALGVPGGIYNVCDDEPLMMREHVLALVRACRCAAPLRVPAGLARLLLGPVAAVLTRSQRVANGKFKRAAGWTPRYPSAREGWQEIAGRLGRSAA